MQSLDNNSTGANVEHYCNQWYFKAADIAAPVMALAGVVVAVYAAAQLVLTF
jgi:hypothetical protein